MNNSTIIAQSTPAGKGALALIRLSGDAAFEIVDKIAYFSPQKNISQQTTHTIHYGWIVEMQGNELQKIDQVLFLIMHAPQTFTGQNTVEITCHNNPFIIQKIIDLAVQNGAYLAQSGEFTRRAFENNKLDLVQAEAINDILCAQTEMALKKSLAQLEGSFSHWIVRLEKQLIKAYAWSEASFEFLDDEGDFGVHIKEQLQEILSTIEIVKKTFDVQKQIREGFRIALIGSVNAGKSSLFNRLLAQERSIVTDIAGTTRDSIEAGLYRNGSHWTLIDTAGLRQTADIIEKAGIQRSFDEAHKADIILLVIDGSRAMTHEEALVYEQLFKDYHHKVIVIITKADKFQVCTHALVTHALQVSNIQNHGTRALEAALEEKIKNLVQQSESPFLINKRHYTILLTLESLLMHIIDMLQGDIQYELVSYHLREALEHISQLTGKSVSEAAMDMVFKEFCVGK